jgi:transcriptional regulator with XRE-family HTH domain
MSPFSELKSSLAQHQIAERLGVDASHWRRIRKGSKRLSWKKLGLALDAFDLDSPENVLRAFLLTHGVDAETAELTTMRPKKSTVAW